jgi:hypothetical protein
MAVRELLRGSVSDEQLGAVEAELASRYDRPAVTLDRLEADNWLSTPCVADDEWFVKVISPQNSVVHALFTAGRNLGAFASGVEGFFDHHSDPVAMSEHELDATRALREAGVPGPDPVDAFGVDGLGVLVLEYIPDFRTLDDLDDAAVADIAPAVFETLVTAHEAGIVHGDLQAENVLLSDGTPAFVDATRVRTAGDGFSDARAYDVASGLGALEPRIGAAAAVEAAAAATDEQTLLAARDFCDFVALRPELQFDVGAVRDAIDSHVG